MAACAIESAAASGNGDRKTRDRKTRDREREGNGVGSGDGSGSVARAGCVISFDGSYAARLARGGASWFPERWTLDGPEPYAVPLPGSQPEEPGTEVLPMADGRVLVHRLADGRHMFSLLYPTGHPTGPGTGEVPLGAVECPDPGTELWLLPPAPGGTRAYALAVGPGSTAVWLVAGGAFGPEHLAEVPGRCSGGVWLGGGDRLLALDRKVPRGRTKTVVVDLERGGEVSPLLQIAEDSDDRLLLADADSGLLLVRSDAPSPGRERLGWGVLGSTLPVRFPECLQPAGCTVTPFAIQPGLVLTPESCAVALRIDGASGSWLGMWRPAERRLHQLRAPEGWLTGSGRWTRDGVLRLPYATEAVPCGMALVEAPVRTDTEVKGAEVGSAEVTGTGVMGAGVVDAGAVDADPGGPDRTVEVSGDMSRRPSAAGPQDPASPGPVPLQQAPLRQAPPCPDPLQRAPAHLVPPRRSPLTSRMVASAFAGRRAAQSTMGRGLEQGQGRGRGLGEGTEGSPSPGPEENPSSGTEKRPPPGGNAFQDGGSGNLPPTAPDPGGGSVEGRADVSPPPPRPPYPPSPTAPEPARPLRVEQVSDRAPAGFRALRVGAGGAPPAPPSK